MKSIAIVGFGLVGRVMALTLLKKSPSIQLSIFDPNQLDANPTCCARNAGGMVAPYTELLQNNPALYELGCISLKLWPTLLALLHCPEPIWIPSGTLLLAHHQDGADYRHQSLIIEQQVFHADEAIRLDKHALDTLEPNLKKNKLYQQCLALPKEAFVHVPRFFQSTTDFLKNSPGVIYKEKSCSQAEIGLLKEKFDAVIDARGLGAKDTDMDLIAVRGEAILVHAPNVKIQHMLRIVHPKKALYVVPRTHEEYYLGATSIYSYDHSPISLKSLLEIGTSAYAICAGFAEARLISTHAATRPSYKTGLPKVIQSDNLWTINGLYRHGYLLTPALTDKVAQSLLSKHGEKI